MVTVRVFVYEGCIDDYIWTYRNKLLTIRTKSDFTQFSVYRSFFRKSELFGYAPIFIRKLFDGDEVLEHFTNSASEVYIESLYFDITLTLQNRYDKVIIYKNSTVVKLSLHFLETADSKTLFTRLGMKYTKPIKFVIY